MDEHTNDGARTVKNDETREQGLSRRDLSLGLIGAGVAAAGATVALGGRARAAAQGGGVAPAFLLNVFLRGGADGLSVVPPYADPDYGMLRNETRLYPPGFFGAGHPDEFKEALPLTPAGPSNDPPAFGLPKALAPLLSITKGGQSRVAFFHATGNADDSQSHFSAQYFMETASSGQAAAPFSSGWIGRQLQTKTDHLATAVNFRGISYASMVTQGLKEGPGVTPVPDPENYQFPVSYAATAAQQAARETAFAGLYGGFGPPLDQSMDAVLEATGLVGAVDFNVPPTGGAVYPPGPFGSEIQKVAQLAKQVPQLEVVDVSLGSWDTHVDQGVHAAGGRMYDLMDALSKSLKAFFDDMDSDPNPRPFIIVVETEFGRKAPENANEGTDHGRAGVAMVIGPTVNGGQVIIRQPGGGGSGWPGLAPGQLVGSDLAVATDIRDVFGEVVEKALANAANVNTVIPPEAASGYQYVPLGFLP